MCSINKLNIETSKTASLPLSPEDYNFNSRVKHKESMYKNITSSRPCSRNKNLGVNNTK